MKVLITGANGFVGKSLNAFLEKDDQFKVVALGRKDLDLLNFDNIDRVLTIENPDAVIHCAVKGGTRFDVDTQETMDQNIQMYRNLRDQRSKFGCLINIGSGAEFDRNYDIRRANESLLFKRSPVDFYGKAKNEIARDVVLTENFYNLRIFGCFGVLENENRFLKIILDKNERSESIEINDDKEMDFVHVNDLARVASFVLKNLRSAEVPKDINVVYSDKHLLSEIANQFIPESDRRSIVKINRKSALSYSGESDTINSIVGLNFSSLSLKTALQTYYNQIKA